MTQWRSWRNTPSRRALKSENMNVWVDLIGMALCGVLLGKDSGQRRGVWTRKARAFSCKENSGRILAELISKVTSSMAGREAKIVLLEFGALGAKECRWRGKINSLKSWGLEDESLERKISKHCEIVLTMCLHCIPLWSAYPQISFCYRKLRPHIGTTVCPSGKRSTCGD